MSCTRTSSDAFARSSGHCGRKDSSGENVVEYLFSRYSMITKDSNSGVGTKYVFQGLLFAAGSGGRWLAGSTLPLEES